ncbi:hypothetical protein GBAR_LOCUS17000 [Geodia barretti]|uniref:Uncharacterized protein n=1 Tax=Geodia barretti TaxID=519541 RepID=A0AA35SH10_GEOBA|nr:hypothetical protein GBAR_LOCUS17000 [Geodia barretti]
MFWTHSRARVRVLQGLVALSELLGQQLMLEMPCCSSTLITVPATSWEIRTAAMSATAPITVSEKM